MLRLQQTLPLYLILVILAFLPFFEGGETPIALFLIHSLCLLSLVALAVRHSRIWIPRFLILFVPFLLALLVSTLIVAPYKYAAVLHLLEYCMAAVFAIAICTALKEYQNEADRFAFLSFLILSVGTTLSLISTPLWGWRIQGSFVNPNDFASWSLLVILLGLFQLERQSKPVSKILVGGLLLLLSLAAAGASSRATFLAAAVFAGIYIWKRRPRPLLIASISLVLFLSAVLVSSRFSGIDPYRYYRLRIWKHTLEGILQDPYLGIGLNMLPYKAYRLNFPADVEVGRFSRVAKSADNQYFQILAETGFLGLFTFLIGWFALLLSLRRNSNSFISLRYSYYVISILALFSLPLSNTGILFLFLYMILFPLVYDPLAKPIAIALKPLTKIVLTFAVALFFGVFVLALYLADREWTLALRSETPPLAEAHLRRAVALNPYQPYYRFVFIRQLIDANPTLDRAKWAALLQTIDESIQLNPLDGDFYAYRAKVYRNLLETTGSGSYFSLAVASYQTALDRSPHNVFLRAEFALFLKQKGRLDLAQAEVEKILDAEPAYLSARLLLAEIKWARQDSQGARSEFVKEEQQEKRFQVVAKTTGEGYIRKLLQVNSDSKEHVRKLIFGS